MASRQYQDPKENLKNFRGEEITALGNCMANKEINQVKTGGETIAPGADHHLTFVLNYIFFFYWSIVALQCCISSHCTTVYMYTCIPSPKASLHPPSHPSTSSHSTKLSSLGLQQLPTSRLFYTWCTCHPNLPIGSAPPSPPAPFSKSVSLFLPCK